RLERVTRPDWGRQRSISKLTVDGLRASEHQISNASAGRQAAARRSIERRRMGLPPGGWRGPSSSAQRASRISSIVTGAFNPSGARKAGQDAIAEASDAHEARMAR